MITDERSLEVAFAEYSPGRGTVDHPDKKAQWEHYRPVLVAALAAQPNPLSAEATGAKAIIRDGLIVISIEVDALPVILSGSCASLNGLPGLWKVTDAEAFAKDVCVSLNDEREDGTTRVHMMFDKAFEHAIEQGAEGVDACTEGEFEKECGRLHHPALAAPAAT